MPAVSKAQQRFMGMVHAADKGETPASPEVAKVSADMKDTDAKDFASTKHDGLPDHVKEQLKSVVREVIREKNGMNEMSGNDVHFKHIMKMYDRGGSFTKKKIGAVVCKDPKATRKDIEEVLFDSDYRDIIEFEDELGLKEIREKYSSVNEEFKHVIHVDTPTQVVSKPVAAQIMALAKKGVRASEIGLEMGFVGNAKLAADTFQKVKNKIYFELDKRNESVNEAKFKSPDYIISTTPASKISPIRLAHADVSVGLKMADKLKNYTLNVRHFKLVHANGKVALKLTPEGKTAVRVRTENDPTYINLIQKTVNDIVADYANDIKESVNEAFPTKKVDAKVIADRMRNHKETKGFADKIEKLKMVSAEDLDKMLPDYVDGGVITKIFKESVNEAPQKVGNVNAFGASKVLGKGKKVLGFVADTPNAVATLIQDFPQAMEIEFKQGFFSDGKLLKSIKKGDKVWKELEKRYLDKQTKDAMKAGFSINEEHDCGCNENHDCGCGGVHEHTHIHEDLSADANGIAGLTASRASAVEDFLEKNNINSNKLYLFLKKGNLKDRMDFVTALVGKPGNPIQKKVISQFSK